MKIAIIQGAFLPVPPTRGGAVEKLWFNLGMEFAKSGIEVIHISKRCFGMPEYETIANVKHHRVRGFDTPRSLPLLKLYDFIYSMRAIRLVPTDAEVVVTNTFWSPLVLPKALKDKAYVDVQRMPRGQLRFYGKAARFRANSSSVQRAVQREIPKKLHDRIVLIPNPLPFPTSDACCLSMQQDRILYCGRVHPEKGIHLLIEAVKRLPIQWPLRIVGPWEVKDGGGGKAYFDQLIRAAEGFPVSIAGPVFDSDTLNQEYKTASVFVYPSLADRGETFGLAPLEAMAWGCVPVVSKIPCFSDFIEDGVNGRIFDHHSPNAIELLANQLAELIQDKSRRLQLAKNASLVRLTHATRSIAKTFVEDFKRIRKKSTDLTLV